MACLVAQLASPMILSPHDDFRQLSEQNRGPCSQGYLGDLRVLLGRLDLKSHGPQPEVVTRHRRRQVGYLIGHHRADSGWQS